MRRNDKIGFGLFFSELKKLGALDGYIKNYMKYHRVQSPLRIPEFMFSKNNLSHSGLSCEPLLKRDKERDRGAIVLYNLLCRRFGNIGISFVWDKTPEGYNYWDQIAEQLRTRQKR